MKLIAKGTSKSTRIPLLLCFVFYPKSLICRTETVLCRRAVNSTKKFNLLSSVQSVGDRWRLHSALPADAKGNEGAHLTEVNRTELVCLMNCDTNAHFTPACFLFHTSTDISRVTSIRVSRAEIDASVKTKTTLENS